MRREGVQHRNPLWLKLVAAGLAGLVVVAAIIVLAPQLLQNPSSDVVVIKADATPFKERPKDAGGMEIPHQDTTCLLYTSPSPRDGLLSRMPSSA